MLCTNKMNGKIDKQPAVINNNMEKPSRYQNPKDLELNDLLNNSINALSQKYQRNVSRDRSPVPKLNFNNIKEFKE